LERYGKRKMDMRFGTWNVGSLYRSGSLKTVTSETAKHKLDLVALQEVRWIESGGQPADVCSVFYENGNDKHYLGIGLFVYRQLNG
jgi:exonuclease III